MGRDGAVAPTGDAMLDRVRSQGLKTSPTFGRNVRSALHGGVAPIVANPNGSGWSCSPHGLRESVPTKPGWGKEESSTFQAAGRSASHGGVTLIVANLKGSGWSCSPHGRRDAVWERVAMDRRRSAGWLSSSRTQMGRDGAVATTGGAIEVGTHQGGDRKGRCPFWRRHNGRPRPLCLDACSRWDKRRIVRSHNVSTTVANTNSNCHSYIRNLRN
jgi:hypothetical protein